MKVQETPQEYSLVARQTEYLDELTPRETADGEVTFGMLSTLRNSDLSRLYILPLLINVTEVMTGAIAVLYALDLGADILQVNLMTMIGSAMSILLLIPFGALSDRVGRKPMLIYACTFAYLGTLAYTFATNPGQLLLAAFIGGLSGGGYFPILSTMIADTSGLGERREALSTLFLFSSLGMVIGPLVGGFLLSNAGLTLRNLYQIDALAQASAIFYVVLLVRETNTRKSDPKTAPTPDVSESKSEVGFRGLLVMTFLFFFYFPVMSQYIPMQARVNLQLSTVEISLLSTFRGLAIMLMRLVCVACLTRTRLKPLLLSALLLGAFAGFLVPSASGFQSLTLITLLYGMSFGIVSVSGSALVSESSKSRSRGVAYGLYNVSQSMGNVTMVATSAIAETSGLVPVFVLGGVSCLGATVPLVHRTLMDPRAMIGDIFRRTTTRNTAPSGQHHAMTTEAPILAQKNTVAMTGD